MKISNSQAFNWDKSPVKFGNALIPISMKKLPVYFDFFDLKSDFKNVYEPAEDTFLMIDVLSLELDSLEKFESKRTMELGCGSGLISCCFLGKLKEKGLVAEGYEHYCVDINDDCVKLTYELLKQYDLHSNVKMRCSNLFEGIETSVLFDIIFFNPPYVTTDDSEYEDSLIKKDISASWAGGERGSQVILKFIDQLENVIHEGSVIYLLLSSENKCTTVINLMKEKYNFQYQVLMKRKAVNERLAVFKFFRNETA